MVGRFRVLDSLSTFRPGRVPELRQDLPQGQAQSLELLLLHPQRCGLGALSDDPQAKGTLSGLTEGFGFDRPGEAEFYAHGGVARRPELERAGWAASDTMGLKITV